MGRRVLSVRCNIDLGINASYFRIQHSLLPSGSLFIRSNGSCTTDYAGDLVGNLTVGMNPDSSATEVLFQVNVATSSSELLHNTGACFNDLGTDRGLFVYVRKVLLAPTRFYLPHGASSGYREP